MATEASDNPASDLALRTWQTAPMDKADIIIAGGGIAGLAAAIAVAPRDTLLLEQATEWQEVGAGVQLGPNAVRALQKLGAWDAVEPITSSPPAIMIKDGVSGHTLKRLPLGQNFISRFGAPYRVAHRADLHRALRQVAESKPQLRTRLNQTVSSLAEKTEWVEVNAGVKAFQGKALLATDGVKSVIRQTLFPGTQAKTTGDTLHRALLPSEARTQIPDGDCVNLWFYPQGHVVHYPAGFAGKLNLVAITPGGKTPEQFFSRSGQQLQSILDRVETWTHWPAFYVEPMPATATGRTLLLGDAAHGTVPYLAQGAAMSLEDAIALMQCLPARGAVHECFASVDKLRTPRTTRLHHAAMKQGKIDHTTGLARMATQLAMRLMPANLALSRMEWVYNG